MPSIARVLLLGIDSPIGLTVMRELGAHGVEVVGVGRGQDSLGRASRHCTRFVERPAGPVAGWLGQAVSDHGTGSVMAVSETDLVELAQIKHAVPSCTIAVPDPEKLALVLDKRRTLGVAHELGIAIPDCWQPRMGEDFTARAYELLYPVAIKWGDPTAIQSELASAGLAFEKVEYADSPAALLAILARYHRLCTWPMVQQYCPGYGLGQMFNMAGGRATLRFQHRRLREWPVTGGVSSFCGSVPLAEHTLQREKSEELLKAIGWEGPAMVEYRHDPSTGTNWLMEINGRFWGSIPLAHKCGAEFGWEAWRTQVARENTPSSAEVTMGRARYVVPDTKHLGSRLAEPGMGFTAKLLLVVGFLALFFDPEMGYYVWSWRDPAPLFVDLRAMWKKLWRRGKLAAA